MCKMEVGCHIPLVDAIKHNTFILDVCILDGDAPDVCGIACGIVWQSILGNEVLKELLHVFQGACSNKSVFVNVFV